MPRRWINRRIIVRVCSLLLLGAVLTIVVAWGLAVRLYLQRGLRYELATATNQEVRWWRATVSPATNDERIDVFRLDRVWVGSDWVGMYSSKKMESPNAGVRYRFGLPLRSLGYDAWDGVYDDFGWHSSWHWDFNVHHNGGVTTVNLPLTPIWSGFAVDTLFFAAVSGLVLGGWREMVRRWRLKRGRCPACKYPIGTSPVCTECGEALTVQVST